jgi:hypothetical protein
VDIGADYSTLSRESLLYLGYNNEWIDENTVGVVGVSSAFFDGV